MLLHQVITAEKVPFSYRVASFGSRFLAWLLDVVVIVLGVFIGLLFGAALEALHPGFGSGFVAIWIFVLPWCYFLLFEWLWLGQTPGKHVLGIRVIHERGTSISFFHSAVRNLLRVPDSLPWWYLATGYGLGLAVAAGNPKHRRLGDWAAGTLVVHIERQARPIVAIQDKQASPFPEATVRHRLLQLPREQQQTLIDLCLRRDQLRVSDRAQLFRAVADYFRSQFDLMPAANQSDEKFIVQLTALLGSGTREGGMAL